VASASPTLAPGPDDLAAAERELQVRLVDAEAVSRAVARLQSAWITAEGSPGCDDPVRAPLAVRLRHFGSAWHDAVQRVRVQADRVGRLVGAPTLVPIVDAERRAAIDLLMGRADVQEQGWLELASWTSRVRLPTCDLQLAPAPGFPRPTIAARDEGPLPVALTAVGGGRICPEALGVEANGVVVVVDGPVCWTTSDRCDCTAAPVEAGAVLGPAGD
jgi:hypothetical protein